MSVENGIVVQELPLAEPHIASTKVLRGGEGYWLSTVKLGRRCFETLIFPASETDPDNRQAVRDPEIASFNITNMTTRWAAAINHNEAVQAVVEVLQPHW